MEGTLSRQVLQLLSDDGEDAEVREVDTTGEYDTHKDKGIIYC